MRRAAVAALSLAVVFTLANGAGAMTRRQKNALDHVSYYLTCATCPRGTMQGSEQPVVEASYVKLDGPAKAYVVHSTHKVSGVAKDRVGWRLFDFWQRGEAWYTPGRKFRKIRWTAGTGAAGQAWNQWREDRDSREIHKGGGQHYRYRRTEFLFTASYAAWTFRSQVWAAQTIRDDGSYTPAHN